MPASRTSHYYTIIIIIISAVVVALFILLVLVLLACIAPGMVFLAVAVVIRNLCFGLSVSVGLECCCCKSVNGLHIDVVGFSNDEKGLFMSNICLGFYPYPCVFRFLVCRITFSYIELRTHIHMSANTLKEACGTAVVVVTARVCHIEFNFKDYGQGAPE